MNEELWAAVCPECHYVDGHARNWQKYVANFFEVVALKRKGIA